MSPIISAFVVIVTAFIMFIRAAGAVMAYIDIDHDKMDDPMEFMIIKSLVFFIFGIVFIPILILSVSIVFCLPLLIFIFLYLIVY